MGVKVEVMREEVIKPASPTPHHLRTLKLSCVDEYIPPIFVAPIFFYKADQYHALTEEVVSLRLKKSLSETLTRFYPLAGRIGGSSVNCNDEGVSFTEARADCLLSDFLGNEDPKSLEQLLPSDSAMFGVPPETVSLLHVKLTFFTCGGVAVAVCVSHKICDAASLTTFVRGWAATTRGHVEALISPAFAESTLLPPAEGSSSWILPFDKSFVIERKCALQRFVFDASNISKLKSKASSERVPNPTRVEVITSLIWKCAAKASPSRPSAMGQAMDLRRWIFSSNQFKQNTVGNLILGIVLREEGKEKEMDIREIVAKLRRAKEEVRDTINQNLQDKMLGETIARKIRSHRLATMAEKNLYGITSWSRMGFYEVDFGWGTPLWVTPHFIYRSKRFTTTTLMDAKDGEGMEAWVQLPEQDMSAFERDAELLAFATPNPPLLA